MKKKIIIFFTIFIFLFNLQAYSIVNTDEYVVVNRKFDNSSSLFLVGVGSYGSYDSFVLKGYEVLPVSLGYTNIGADLYFSFAKGTNYNQIIFYDTSVKGIFELPNPIVINSFYCKYGANSGYEINSKLYGYFQFKYKNNIIDVDNRKITYNFTDIPSVTLSDIILTDSFDNKQEFKYKITGNSLIITLSDLLAGSYTLEVSKVTNSLHDDVQTIIDIPTVSFNIDEPLTLIDSVFDKLNNIIEFIFNKHITVEESDITVIDENNISHSFISSLVGNILSIDLGDISAGNYFVNVDKVITLGSDESIKNLEHKFTVEENYIKLIQKNFGTYIPSSLENLILTFDREIESAVITLTNNTENIIMESNLIIKGGKLIIDYDSFKENSNYTLTINDLIAVDGNKLENPLVFNFKTVKTTGDSGIDIIISEFLNIFTEAQNRGIKIVVLAIGIGVIFIISKWLWNKTKLWLKKS